jgi:hypothetical protein
MSTFTASRSIRAPVDLVFQTVSEIEKLSEALPHIVKVEFLSDTHTGVGTRFRETRLMHGREAVTTLQVTEYEVNDHIRLVADAGGTIWDSVFSVKEENGQTRLQLVMEGRPYRFLARVFNFFIGGLLQKALEGDLEAVKTFCEKKASLVN